VGRNRENIPLQTAAVAIENSWLYDELRDADRRKDEFLAVLGHELRNPLGIINTVVELLRRIGPDDARTLELEDLMRGQVRHMARLIDDLLDVSRIAQSKIPLKKEPCDLAAIVRSTVNDHRPALEESGLLLRFEAPDEPLWVIADPTRLAQMLGNVLYNAQKFTDSGGTVTVEVQKTQGGEAAELTINDTGLAMDADTLTRIFEPFSQGEQTVQRSQGGLGWVWHLSKDSSSCTAAQCARSARGWEKARRLRSACRSNRHPSAFTEG